MTLSTVWYLANNYSLTDISLIRPTSWPIKLVIKANWEHDAQIDLTLYRTAYYDVELRVVLKALLYCTCKCIFTIQNKMYLFHIMSTMLNVGTKH